MTTQSIASNTVAKSSATLASTTVIRVVDDPAGTPNSKKTTIGGIGTFYGLTPNGATVTASTPLSNLVQTWNNAAVTFTSLKLNVTDTASASGSVLLDLQTGGTSQLTVRKDGLLTTLGGITLAGSLLTTSGHVRVRTNTGLMTLGTSDDVILARDTANTLAQRNGANAQTIRIYNTYTDASNYERHSLSWTSNVARWFSEAAGTGTTRNMEIIRGSTSHWTFNSAGNNFGAHLLAQTDNTYDIGASGANRPHDVFIANSLNVGGAAIVNTLASVTYVQVASGSSLRFGSGRSRIRSSADGMFELSNAAETDFSRLNFGGATSSFPALKRSATILQARLADDSAFAPIQGIHRTHNNAVAETPTATHTIEIQDASGATYKVLAVAV